MSIFRKGEVEKREQILIGKEIYEFCLSSCKINKIVNTIFISTVKLTSMSNNNVNTIFISTVKLKSMSDVAFYKRTADNGSFCESIQCLWL